MPIDAKEGFSVGWITLSESYVRNAGVWGLALKAGAQPLVLRSGDCIVYGVVPAGYELENYKNNGAPLKLNANSTYVFRLSSSYQATDTYRAVFCVSERSDGTRTFIQYALSTGEGEVIPICDGRLNANKPGR
ncbi:hypothetical protein D3C80_1708390 [compost metagenome]